jgi:outer membrane receptor protein involved in Fe transport
MAKLLIGTLLLTCLNQSLYAQANTLDEELKWLQAESTVEVVSKQKEDKNTAAGIVSVISREDITHYGGNNLFEILNRVTSVYTLGTSVFMKNVVSMRGNFSDSTASHVLFLMNGRPFRDSTFGGVNESILRDFPIHHIDKIEIIRGAGSALYGTNAYTAVINIVTQKNKQTGLTVRGRYGSYQTGQVESEFAWQNDQAAITGALRYRNSEGALFSAAHDDTLQRSHFRQYEEDESASLTAQWQDFSLNGFIAQSHHKNWGPSQTADGHPVRQERVFLDLGYRKDITDYWTSQWNLTYNQLTDEQEVSYFDDLPNSFRFQDTFTRTSENNLLFEQTQFFNFFHKRLNLLIGGLVEWQTGIINQGLAGNSLPRYNHLKSSIYGELSYALLQDLPFVHQLKLTAGGQWNRMDHLERASFETSEEDKPLEGEVGRLGLVYEMTPALGLKLLYSQAYRAPAAFESEVNTTIIRGSRNLQPERIETADAQLFYHSPDYQAAFTAFRSRQSKFISVVCGTPCVPFRWVNGESAVYKGFELETQAVLFKGLQWKGSYTFQTNRDGQGQNNTSPMPNHMAKMGLTYDINEDFQASVFYSFFNAAKTLPQQAQNNPVAGNDHLLSLNTNYQLNKLLGLSQTKHLTLSFYLDNVLNEKTNYPVTATVTNRNSMPGNPGRTLFGELAIEF